MFGHRFFSARYFPPRYFPPSVGAAAPDVYFYPGTRDVRRAKGRGEILSDAPGRARARVREPIESEG